VHAEDLGAIVYAGVCREQLEPATACRVFDLFYTTKAAGTGVGLAMARRLVERQGGTIAVESAPGAGATFRIRLPLAGPVSACSA